MGPHDHRHPVFTSPELEARFRRFGFVRIPFLNGPALDQLIERVGRLRLHGNDGFVDTASGGLDFQEREALHQTLVEAFRPVADRLLADYYPVTSSLLTKWPGGDSSKEIHRDPRMVDEDRFRMVCVWVPFIDVDEPNGALAVLAGSHEIDSGPRPIPRARSMPPDPVPALRFEDLESVPASAGDAVIFDIALAHGSSTNRGGVARVAAALAFAPRSARLSISFCHPDDRVERLDVPDAEEFRRMDWSSGPTQLRSLGYDTKPSAPITADEFRELSHRVVAELGAHEPHA